MNHDIIGKTKKGVYWNFIFKGPYEITRFCASIIIARMLDPRDFGIVSIGSMLIFYANSITNLGFNQALVQRNQINTTHINSVFTLEIAISVFMTVLCLTFSTKVAQFFNSPESHIVIKVMSLTFILTIFYELPYALLRRDMNFKVTSIIDTLKESLMLIITLTLAYLNFGYWAIVWGMIISLFLGAVCLCVKTRWRPKFQFQFTAIRELYHFGLWSFIRGQLYFFGSRLDRLLVGRYFGPAILGIYDKAKSFSQMPNENVTWQLNTVFFSSFSKLQNSIDDVKKLQDKYLLMISMVIFPIYLGLYAISECFVETLLGQKWTLMIFPLQMMCLNGIPLTINGSIGTLLNGIGFIKSYTILEIIGTIIFAVFSLVFIREGINAIAVVILISSILLLIMNIRLLGNKLNLSTVKILKAFIPVLLCNLIMVVSVKAARYLILTETNFFNLSLLIVIGATIYLGSVFMLPFSNLQEIKKTMFKWIKSR